MDGFISYWKRKEKRYLVECLIIFLQRLILNEVLFCKKLIFGYKGL